MPISKNFCTKNLTRLLTLLKMLQQMPLLTRMWANPLSCKSQLWWTLRTWTISKTWSNPIRKSMSKRTCLIRNISRRQWKSITTKKVSKEKFNIKSIKVNITRSTPKLRSLNNKSNNPFNRSIKLITENPYIKSSTIRRNTTIMKLDIKLRSHTQKWSMVKLNLLTVNICLPIWNTTKPVKLTTKKMDKSSRKSNQAKKLTLPKARFTTKPIKSYTIRWFITIRNRGIRPRNIKTPNITMPRRFWRMRWMKKRLRPKNKCNSNKRPWKIKLLSKNRRWCIYSSIRPKTFTKSIIKRHIIQLKNRKPLLSTKRSEISKLWLRVLLRRTNLTSKLAKRWKRLSIRTLERANLKSTSLSTQCHLHQSLSCRFRHLLNSLLSRLWPTNMNLIKEGTRWRLPILNKPKAWSKRWWAIGAQFEQKTFMFIYI